jgi:hypothetical protein
MVRDDELRAAMRAGVKTAAAGKSLIGGEYAASLSKASVCETVLRRQSLPAESTFQYLFTSEEAGARLQSDFIQTAMAGTEKGLPWRSQLAQQDCNFLQQEISPRG